MAIYRKRNSGSEWATPRSRCSARRRDFGAPCHQPRRSLQCVVSEPLEHWQCRTRARTLAGSERRDGARFEGYRILDEIDQHEIVLRIGLPPGSESARPAEGALGAQPHKSQLLRHIDDGHAEAE